MSKSKIKSFVLVGIAIILIFSLCACKKDSAGGSSDSGGGPAESVGEVKELVIASGGKISAICPKDWNDFTDSESSTWEDSLYFSEADAAGDYSKPYFLIIYSDVETTVAGAGEEVTIESAGVTWKGLYDSNYKSFNITTVIDGGASITLMSRGMDKDNNIFKAVLASVEITK